MITTILFDLDGTLLPMDEELFIKTYLGGLVQTMVPHNYEPNQLVKTIWKGMQAMVQNDGSKTNEQVFWDVYASVYGDDKRKDVDTFADYYNAHYVQTKNACGFNEKVPPMIAILQQRGLNVVIATNPFFPRVATRQRIQWAGLDPDSFKLFTTYENSRHCKPNLDYYRDILQQLGVEPSECIMVGNDAQEDMIASELGIKVFLLTDNLINKHNLPIDNYPQGNVDDLVDFLNEQLNG